VRVASSRPGSSLVKPTACIDTVITPTAGAGALAAVAAPASPDFAPQPDNPTTADVNNVAVSNAVMGKPTLVCATMRRRPVRGLLRNKRTAGGSIRMTIRTKSG
jgi:hypothetical protein